MENAQVILLGKVISALFAKRKWAKRMTEISYAYFFDKSGEVYKEIEIPALAILIPLLFEFKSDDRLFRLVGSTTISFDEVLADQVVYYKEI